ncbi:MAG: carboxy terminal-processing peptidase [Thermoguttaceae bacterium]|nr:carboxy terminal-processing peptidase [Thermoguttaceae bacterium]
MDQFNTLKRLSVFLTFAVAIFYSTSVSFGDDGLREPNATDKQIARIIDILMPHEHLSQKKIDAEYSQRWLDNFIKALDYQKAYFYKSDIEKFQEQVKFMPAWLAKGDIRFAYVIYKTYIVRLDQRMEQVQDLLKQPMDFTVDETICLDRDKLDYPKNAAEALERWRKRVKYDLLILKVDDKEGQEAIDKLSRRYKSFQKRMHQTDSNELLEMYLTAMTTAFDPHTTYMSASTLENFEINMRLELEGIGATLGSEDGYTIVKHLVPGGAAEKEGSLKVEDKIIGVGQGADGPFEDVVDMKLDDVVKKVRGKANTVVRLEVLPADGGKTKDIKITRAKIELKDSAAKGKVFEAGTKPDGTPYKIGVIDLPSFYADMSGMRNGKTEYRSTTRDMKRILEDFNAQGCDACIVDLRANGGGSLPESINTTGLFIKTGPVVQVKGPKRGRTSQYDKEEFKIECYSDHNDDVTWDKPLVVLVSKFSASASEIFAGAIQDYGRGLIVGDQSTHGKGTVQSLLPLGDALFNFGAAPKLGALKVTIQQFYRPDGDSTQNRGVVSDVELPSITSHMDVGESDLDFALAFDQVPAQRYLKFNLVPKNIVKYLTQASAVRCAQSEDFQKTNRKIECYLKNKDKSNITLNEKKFFEERAELIPEEEEKKQLEDTIKPDGSDIEETPYLREVLNITADYVKALQIGVANMPNPATIKAKEAPNDPKREVIKPANAL